MSENSENNRISEKEKFASELKRKVWHNYYLYIVAAFYLFQGFYQAGEALYITKFLTAENNFSYEEYASILATVNIPLFLKMFIGLLSDKVPLGKLGRRKPYIFIGSLLYIPIFWYVSTLTEYSSTWLISMVIGKFIWVMVDGTLDALTVDVTPIDKMGSVQGAANGGRAIGFAIGSLTVAAVASSSSWNTAIFVVGIVASLQLVGAISIKEPLEIIEEPLPFWYLFKNTFFKKRSWLGFIFIAFIIAGTGVYQLGNAYIVQDLEISDILLGWVAFTFSITVAVGAFVTGYYCDRVGSKKITYAIILLHWVLVIPWVFVKEGATPATILVAAGSIGISWGAIRVPAYRIAMELCPPELEGFMYSTYMSFANIGEFMLANLIVSAFLGILPLTTAFFMLIPLSIIAALILPKLNPWTPDQLKSLNNNAEKSVDE